MNLRGLTRTTLLLALVVCAVFSLLLSACQPANVSTNVPTVQLKSTQAPMATQAPAATQLPEATQTPAEATVPPSTTTGELVLDLSGIAQGQTVETVPAVSASAGGPIWDVMPEYRRVTLQGYPVTNHLMKPQIFVYPAMDLAGYNEAAGKTATDLQGLLQSQQAGNFIPFLPFFNAQQVMHAQVQYLDFKNGKGVRFLTQFDQAPIPINNYELFYTFQGLTSDGKYYIAAVLPVAHPDLPAEQQVTPQQAEELKDFPAYIAKTVTWLEQQPGSSFTPDLAKLDALIQSIEIK